VEEVSWNSKKKSYRILILAMTLKRFGFSDEEIKKSIIMVFEIRI